MPEPAPSRSLPNARRAARRAVRTLERVARELWLAESRLTIEGQGSGGAEAEEVAALLGCALVDRLHPAIETLRAVAEGTAGGGGPA